MFKRAILQQSRQFSARTIVQRAPVLVRGARNTYPAATRLARPYSSEAEVKKEEGEKKVDEKLAKEQAELSEIAKELDGVQKELEKKTAEAKDFKDKFTRTVADYRNLQDRTVRDVRAAKDFAIQKFAKDLVDSVDNLDRALAAVPEEARADSARNKELVDLYNGLRMTEDILLSTLKKHGLEKVNPINEKFDPNLHDAIFQAPMADKEAGTVFHVQQTGFTLNGRTIRAAKVGVVQAK